VGIGGETTIHTFLSSLPAPPFTPPSPPFFPSRATPNPPAVCGGVYSGPSSVDSTSPRPAPAPLPPMLARPATGPGGDINDEEVELDRRRLLLTPPPPPVPLLLLALPLLLAVVVVVAAGEGVRAADARVPLLWLLRRPPA
jgi:hypothetical protein